MSPLRTNQIRICVGLRNRKESSSNKSRDATTPLEHLGYRYPWRFLISGPYAESFHEIRYTEINRSKRRKRRNKSLLPLFPPV